MRGEFGSRCHGEKIGLISNVTERDLVTLHTMAGRGDPARYRSSFISAEPCSREQIGRLFRSMTSCWIRALTLRGRELPCPPLLQPFIFLFPI